jgi:hypothetical protein
MPTIVHHLTHYLQPTNNSCGQAALAMLLSHYSQSVTPEDIMDALPVNLRPDGTPWGTISQQLAGWCLDNNYDVTLHTADFQTLDVSWQSLSKANLLDQMRASLGHHTTPALGDDWSDMYLQSYIDFVEKGGNLHIHPYLSSRLIDSILQKSPLFVNVSFSVLYATGRGRSIGLRQSIDDDIHGITMNHSVVVYGIDENDNYIIADPWRSTKHITVERELLVASIEAAQVECDALLFYLTPRGEGHSHE